MYFKGQIKITNMITIGNRKIRNFSWKGETIFKKPI